MQIIAAVSREGLAVPVVETLELEAPRANEILVRVVATGICHTDVKTNETPGPRPFVLGHEGAGVVEQVGTEVATLRPGDHVVLSLNTCGACDNCREGHSSYCREMRPRNFGGSRMDGTSPLSKGGETVHGAFFGQSSFANFAIAEAASAVKVPQDAPLELLGPLGCGVLTGAGSVLDALRMQPGQSLAVFGAGAVGLSAVMAAKLAGASEIVAVDVVESRLKLAEELGATRTFDARMPDLGQAIAKATGGGVDFAFVTASAPAAFTEAVASLGALGVMAFVTPPPAGWAPDMSFLMRGGRRIQGILMGGAAPSDLIPRLIEHYRAGRYPFDKLVRFYPLADIETALHDMHAGTTIKPILLMPH